MQMRQLESWLFSAFLASDKLPPLAFLYGIQLFSWMSQIPWKPLSTSINTSGCAQPNDRLNIEKSCSLPLPDATEIMRLSYISMNISIFMVWRFFLPEYHSTCLFGAFYLLFRNVNNSNANFIVAAPHFSFGGQRKLSITDECIFNPNYSVAYSRFSNSIVERYVAIGCVRTHAFMQWERMVMQTERMYFGVGFIENYQTLLIQSVLKFHTLLPLIWHRKNMICLKFTLIKY